MKNVNLTPANCTFTTNSGKTVNLQPVLQGIANQVGAYARKGGKDMAAEDLEDLRQDAFRKAVVSHAAFDSEKSKGCPQAYGASIARRLEWDAYRRDMSRKARFESLDESPSEWMGDAAGADTALESEEAVSHIMETLSTMKENHRTVLEMTMGDYTAEEMAEALGCSVGAVYTRLCKARKAFAAALGREFLSDCGYRLSA